MSEHATPRFARTMDLPPAIFLMGPTASGKTNVAVDLVRRLPVELISVDSALVFRDMDIGTAKPDAATLARAPHHLIDIIAPTEAYSAAAFRRDVLRLMADITQRGRIPLLVGGTMLYFKALREGLNDLPQSDPEVRAALDAEIAEHGIEHRLVDELHMLREKYPLHPNMTAMRCVGYRQAWQFMEGEIDDVQLQETGIIATRQLAKRQLTWLRSMPDNIELDCLAPDLTQRVIDKLAENDLAV